MRYGIIADVHANLEALNAVLEALKKEQVEQILCAGDSVSYGADPALCLERIQAEANQIICGNHDRAVTGKMDLAWFNPFARAAVEWTATQLNDGQKEYLANLPFTWNDKSVTLAHGSLHEPEKFHYLLDPESAAPSLEKQETPVCFVGHTHVPGFFIQAGDRVGFFRQNKLQVKSGERVLVNVGSVGQPRDGNPKAAFATYDTEDRTVEIRRVAYPIETTQQKIVQTGLPSFLAERLLTGN